MRWRSSSSASLPEAASSTTRGGGHVAHLFVVTEALVGERRPPPHQLLVTGHSFARFKDSIALQQALIGGDVAQQLARAGDRTVELY